MQGKATLAEHPIHPMLIGFPIGFFGAVLVSDVISIWGNPAFWPQMSTWLIAFGVVGTLLAAVFGFIDYLTAPMSAAVKRTATTHMILNLIVVAIYIAAFFVRYGNPVSTLGYVLTYVGLGLLVISGWYGGHLVYVGLVGTKPARETGVEGRVTESTRTPVQTR
ncbi:MAG TPA: DUF2231 domain-containing protein [Candidatus Baltobacteraceae bacterium]|nr:DUF2231 domain-containing protein [Candidatus Baltobacteraceae bacterium]